MWFKKKSVLVAEHHYDTENSVDGTDWRTTNGFQNWPVSETLPSAADAGNYFYLPALGYYASGQLYGVGDNGYYWSSSARPWNNTYAYGLTFNSAGISLIYNGFLDFGFRVDGFE